MKHVKNIYIVGSIKVSAHGLEWEIEQANDYTGFIVTNNAAAYIKTITIEKAFEIIDTNH